jgi:hypothetical protein
MGRHSAAALVVIQPSCESLIEHTTVPKPGPDGQGHEQNQDQIKLLTASCHHDPRNHLLYTLKHLFMISIIHHGDIPRGAPVMGIYKRKGEGTEVWYLRYWDFDGKLVRKSSGTTNKAVAQAMLAAAEAEARQKRAQLEQAVTGETPTTKQRRFSWRHWTTDALLWHRDLPQSRYDRLLARKTERPKVPALGEIIETAQVTDRQAAIAAGHLLLDQFAHEVRGAVSIEIHISGPEQAIEDEWEARLRSIKVTPEAVEQAKALGMRGNVESQLRIMALNSQPYPHPRANRREGPFILHLEGQVVRWVGFADDSSGPV